jgi:GNAT superfamily N-acetyltransferase
MEMQVSGCQNPATKNSEQLYYMREIVCRRARNEDIEAIRHLLGQLQENEHIFEVGDQAFASAWDEIQNSPSVTCFVAEVSGSVLATMTIAVIPNLTRGARPFAVLQNVVTSKSHRGTGIGRALWNHVAVYAWSKNCYQVLVQTGKPNAVDWYLNNGFTKGKVGMMMQAPDFPKSDCNS